MCPSSYFLRSFLFVSVVSPGGLSNLAALSPVKREIEKWQCKQCVSFPCSYVSRLGATTITTLLHRCFLDDASLDPSGRSTHVFSSSASNPLLFGTVSAAQRRRVHLLWDLEGLSRSIDPRHGSSSTAGTVATDVHSSDGAPFLIRAGYHARVHREQRCPSHRGVCRRPHHELRAGNVRHVWDRRGLVGGGRGTGRCRRC